MKIKSILSLAIAAMMLIACNDKDADIEISPIADGTVAYLSINIATEIGTRSSSENDGSGESAINTLYLITFDDADKVLQAPGSSLCFVKVDNIPANNKPAAQKVSAKSEKLLLIANPGPKLLNVIQGLTTASTYTILNNAIASATVGEINHAGGFTMINSGNEGSLTEGAIIDDPLIDLTDNGSGDPYVKEVTTTDADAIVEAEGDRVTVKIERLASKVELTVPDNVTATSTMGNASFSFIKWTLDAINSTFYPFADKIILKNNHTQGFYTNNFYTKDPNYVLSGAGTGILLATVDNTTYEPIFPTGAPGWLDKGTTYCIENTMEAAAQKFKNATRVVIKATYYPVDTWTGDWFSWAGVNYKDLDELQAAYAAAPAVGSHLRDACDAMLAKINAYNGSSVTDFTALTTGDLSAVTNGGEVIKNGNNPVINWYQNGLNYYYYEIRHDNDRETIMEFAKYGVVRNNWYALKLNSVSGPGTPWYPDIDNPGPGDPDPNENIDEAFGYLGITVEVAPWIYWAKDLDL